jgi:hypothetical protein
MSVPEAAMNHERGTILWKNDVRSARQILAVQPEAISKPVKQ